MAIKMQCIDEQHAIIAEKSMRSIGRKTIRLGRAVVSEGKWNTKTTRILVENMAHSRTPTDYDIMVLREEGTRCDG